MNALLRYDEACRAVAEAKTVDEISDWIDKAAAVREYGRRIKNRQIEIDAMEIRIQAKRRRGEILRELKAQGKIRDGRKKRSPEDDRLTLEDLGISKNESSEEQTIAALEGDSFSRLVARCRSYAEAHPEKHSFDVLKPPPADGAPINGARAVMGSREEPDDSLDYFPTPPWATRALIERVLPRLGIEAIGNAWEPACGEGHIAEVLAEYASGVVATDIFEYGYGQPRLDFLSPENPYPKFLPAPDWIITNPPFGDKGEEFALKALDRAKAGVAMFFRLQWLESVGRYENIFQPFPPAMIAQFAERVPLHKGRWEPTGSTATAYLWIVWLSGRPTKTVTEFFWIPPGCRESMTKPDDVERFTAHPVVKKIIPKTSAGDIVEHSSDTGEVIETEHNGRIDLVTEVEKIITRHTAIEPAIEAKPQDDNLDIPPFLRRSKDAPGEPAHG